MVDPLPNSTRCGRTASAAHEGLMSTPMSHHPRSPLGSRRLTSFFVVGLAIAGVIVALALTRSGSNSPNPVHAVPAPAAASPAPSGDSQAVSRSSPFEHGMPSLNPQARRTTSRHAIVGEAAPSAQHYAPNLVLRKEGLDPRTGR
jgi:hypothetical protein